MTSTNPHHEKTLARPVSGRAGAARVVSICSEQDDNHVLQC